jgi:YD repeat-containing protein
VPANSTLNITGPITVEAWIKVNAIDGSYHDIVSRMNRNDSASGGGYSLTVTNLGKLRLDLFQSNSSWSSLIGSTVISANTWHHVAGVFDGGQMRIYLNGVLDGSLNTTSGQASGTGLLRIGKAGHAALSPPLYLPSYAFAGLIDEVRVSAAALYISNFTPGFGPGSNVRGFWKFDGQTANDFSGNANHGSLLNGASYATDAPTATNSLPSVSLTDPLNNTSFIAGSSIVLDATASDSDGSVTKVDFYQGATLLGTDSTSPYTFVWSNAAAGNYSLTAKATDSSSATTSSTEVNVTVVSSGGSHSLALNGTTAYVDVPGSTSLNITGPITVEAWIKVNAIDGSYHDIVSRMNRNNTASGGGYSLTVTNLGKLRLDLFQSNSSWSSLIGATAMSANTWHHVAGVFDGSQMRIYLNGVLDGSLNTTMGQASGSGPLRIGRAGHEPNAPPLYLPSYIFSGRIDDVRVSAAALYSSNFTPGLGPGSNVRGLWKFDGQSANDFSGNGNHASLQNGATYSTDGPVTAGGGGSQRPAPNANGPYSGQLTPAVQFSSSGSFDPDGTITSYRWNFGDGATATTANPSHAYAAPGLYIATLTVTDNAGLRASATASVTIITGGNVRLDPLNQTGGSGENPLSRNFNWTTSVVSLPGRAGMNLNLALSYNSLVWTKTGASNISFDDDRGFPSPGFRLGFPVMQPLYYNADVGKYAFLLIGSDGSRTELRRVGTSTLYEAADSSYLLLDSSTMTLRATDGTQLKYELKGAEFQCTEIKDRNGNYITVNYLPSGRIDTVPDTLGRSIKFNYNTNGLLTSITQTWNQTAQNPTTHTWASFEYSDTTIQTNFTELTVSGTSNGATIKTLSKIALADSSHYDFSYTSWGQVWKVGSFAADNHLLNYRAYKLPGSPLQATGPQTDCPRFIERRDWAENWNENASGVEQEAITLYSAPVTADWTMPDSTLKSGTRVEVTTPDGTVNKIYFVGTAGASSAWRRGLPALLETYSGGAWQRKVMTTWTQDDESILFPSNPRVIETNVYDPAGNRARVQMTYQQHTFGNGTSCWLPRDVYEYASDATTKLRSTRTDYHTGSVYTARRIIGLVSERRLYEGDVNGELMAKVGYFYDNENGATSIQGNDAPVQHDNTNYTASFVTGRANVTSVRRYNVTNTTQFTTTSSKYNTAGAVVSTTDAAGHMGQVSYADSFSDEVVRNTLAYPTKLTDADGYYSTSTYNYDFGGLTLRKNPPPNFSGSPASQPAGPEQTFSYDAIGRLLRVTNEVNDAYTRFVYPASQTRIDSYTTIQDGLGEAYSFEFTDGAGRVIGTAKQNPGSQGGYSGQRFMFDSMGRVIKVSNPAETGAAGDPSQWTTAGDDGGTGWIFKQQTYDWKGRPLVVTNQDGTTRTASYSGCGCAGGEVVTVTDEGTIDGGNAKRRQQKIYSDVLGRTIKIEALNWQGGSVYSTTVNTYNARDQLKEAKQYAGAEGSSSFQTTSMSYDGFGRLSSRHVPEQATGTSTLYTYTADDTILSITDARGASANYARNNRHLITGITYSAPAGTPTASSVTLAYDATGNRLSMTDGAGSQTYSYDQLSRLVSETRTFTNVGSFTLTYAYNLAGELKKLTDASNTTINYSYDLTGRLAAVTGSDTLVGGVSDYASGFQYRAFGNLKQLTTGTRTSSFNYNSRLQPTNFAISGGVVNQDYEYYDDGRLSFVHNNTDNNFDRSFSYDHASRLTRVVSGGAARDDAGAVPMYETFSYDAFDNTTSRQTETWSNGYSDSATYTNHRRTGWGYNANGQVSTIDTRTYTYNAAGKITSLAGQRWTPNGFVSTTTSSGFDGDGSRVREESSGGGSTVTYFLRSSVLGGAIVAELNSSGQKQIGYVYTPSGTALATQIVGQNYVMLKQVSPIGASQYEFFASNSGTGSDSRREFDPLGANVRLNAGPTGHAGDTGDIPGAGGSMGSRSGAIENPGAGCALDGVWVPCSMAFRLLRQGAAKDCPENDCGPQARWVITDGDDGPVKVPFLTLPFMAFANGASGYFLSYLELSPQAQADAVPDLQALAASGGTLNRIDGSARVLGVQTQNTQNPLSQTQNDAIQQGINRASELLSNQNCFDFINNVLQRAASIIALRWWGTGAKASPIDGVYPNVNPIVSHNRYADLFAAGRVGASNISGVNGQTVTYGQTNPNGSITWNNEFFTATANQRGLHTIHEALHLFTGFNDEVLANAARFVAGQNARDFSTEDDPVGAASTNLNQLIRQRCSH